MRFTLRDHTADVAVEATADSLGDVFAAAADGLAAAHHEDPPGGGERFDLSVAAERRDALLFDYLDELIYQRDVQGVLPVENAATVASDGEAWTLDGSARGIPLESLAAREVKAVTYSEMELVETANGWRAYVVLDV